MRSPGESNTKRQKVDGGGQELGRVSILHEKEVLEMIVGMAIQQCECT